MMIIAGAITFLVAVTVIAEIGTRLSELPSRYRGDK